MSARTDAPDEPDRWEERNSDLVQHLESLEEELRGRGMEPDEASDVAAGQLREVIDETAPQLADSFLSESREWVDESAEYAKGFRERLRDYWGEALDQYMAFVGCVEWLSNQCLRRNANRAEGQDYALFDVVAQLNGQAIRVAKELHTLLAAGYPLGGLALSRTLYEISVRAIILADFGREPGHEELANRFVMHDLVVNFRDAETFQRDAEVLGYEPFDDDYVETLRARAAAAKEQFGPGYGGQYGWAVGLPGIGGRRFSELEELAKVSHRRGYYQWASHLVHSDAKALRLSRIERGGVEAVLTGATNSALGDPADHALWALYNTCISFLASAEPVAPIDLYGMRALGVLLSKVQHELVSAEEAVSDAEERFQEGLASEGKRVTPWGVVDLRPGESKGEGS